MYFPLFLKFNLFFLASFHCLKPITNDGGEETGVPRKNPLMMSFRKCRILKPENSNTNRDLNPHSSNGGRRFARTADVPTITPHINHLAFENQVSFFSKLHRNSVGTSATGSHDYDDLRTNKRKISTSSHPSPTPPHSTPPPPPQQKIHIESRGSNPGLSLSRWAP